MLSQYDSDYKLGKNPPHFLLTLSYYVVFMKILKNRFHSFDRTFLRNVCFDFLRCRSSTLLYALLFEGIDGLTKHMFQNLLRDFVIVATFSLIVNTWANQRWHKRYPVLWSILILEWKCNLALQFLSCYNRAEITF